MNRREMLAAALDDLQGQQMAMAADDDVRNPTRERGGAVSLPSGRPADKYSVGWQADPSGKPVLRYNVGMTQAETEAAIARFNQDVNDAIKDALKHDPHAGDVGARAVFRTGK